MLDALAFGGGLITEGGEVCPHGAGDAFADEVGGLGCVDQLAGGQVIGDIVGRAVFGRVLADITQQAFDGIVCIDFAFSGGQGGGMGYFDYGHFAVSTGVVPIVDFRNAGCASAE